MLPVCLALVGCTSGPLRQLRPTAHFVITTQLPARYDEPLAQRFEAAYADVAALFAHRSPPPWPGICDVRCYRSRAAFEEAVVSLGWVTPHPAARAYQIATGSRVVILVHSAAWRWHDQVFPSFAHEVTHAFLTHYKGLGRLPVWVQEGLAQHFEFRQPEAEAARRRHLDMVLSADGEHLASALRGTFAAATISADNDLSYAMAWRMVEELLARAPGLFSRFVQAMKEGKDPEDALGMVYGWRAADLIGRCAE